MSHATVRDCVTATLPKIIDPRGNLTFIEGGRHVPFTIRRTYWIYDVPGGQIRGGHAYPDLILAAEKKPLRIYLQDGRNDNRGRLDDKSRERDWVHQNVRMADALTKKGYDVNYTWGIGNHGQKQGDAIRQERTDAGRGAMDYRVAQGATECGH